MAACVPATMTAAECIVTESLAEEDFEQNFEQQCLKNVGPTSPSCCSSTSTADSSCSDLSEEDAAADEALHADQQEDEDEEAGLLGGDEDLDAFFGEPRKAPCHRRAVSGSMSIRELLSQEDQEDCRKHRASPTFELPSVLEADETERLAASDDTRLARRVQFDISATTVHHICPYSEVYGLHPRTFDFDRNFWMVPAKGWQDASMQQCFVEEEDNSESDSDSDEGEWEEWTPPKDYIRDAHTGALVIE